MCQMEISCFWWEEHLMTKHTMGQMTWKLSIWPTLNIAEPQQGTCILGVKQFEMRIFLGK